MIEVKNVDFKYKNGKGVLKNINLKIEEGEIISIIGSNGEGKSTLIKVISGILKPTSGEVKIDELDAHKKKNFKDIRKKIGIVFQNPENQILMNRVYDDIEFALKNLGLDNREERIKQSLGKVGLEGFEEKDTFKLSLGQKQRVNIASILALDSKYIILDEPTTMIDSSGKEKIYQIIKQLKQEKKTIIFVTNNMNEILLSDKVLVIKDNKIEQVIKKEDIFDKIDLLENNEIQIPDVMKLVRLLNQEGMDLKLEEYTLEELARKIVNFRDGLKSSQKKDE